MSLRDRYGPTALITGASSGIGEVFARSLAAEGCNLVLVARRAERLEALAQELAAKHGVRCRPVTCDLAAPNAGQIIQDSVANLDISIDILVNNAGFGVLGAIDAADPNRSLGMVDVNCRAVVDLTQRFLPQMKTRGKGAIIILSSVVGAVPAPWFAVYSATKSFDLYFGEALHAECKGSGVDVLTVLPGLTRTEFQAGSGMRDYHSPYRSAEQVVKSALSALGRKAIVVDGWHNKLLVHASRFLPRAILLRISRAVMKSELKG